MQFMSKKSQKYHFFFHLYLCLLLWVKKVLFSSIALPDRSDCFPFFHKAAQSLFSQFHFRFFLAVELPKLLQKAIIQQITDVKLFAYPLKQNDHFSTHGINTTFHQIIQHHNVLHLEAVSNAEQPVHNDSHEDICPLLLHRHASSRFREEI